MNHDPRDPHDPRMPRDPERASEILAWVGLAALCFIVAILLHAFGVFILI